MSYRVEQILPFPVALVVVAVALILCGRPLARGDGLAYFMWLDSIAGDGDMDLGNQAQIFAHLNTYQVRWNEETQEWGSVFPYGSAILLTPFYWLGRLVDNLGWLPVNPDYFISMQGRPLAYSLFPMFGVFLYALGATALAYRCARFFVSSVPAAASALFLFLGTPMLYYATIEPFMSHVPAAFLITLSLYFVLRGEQDQQRPFILAAGITGGLATLARWQMALLVGTFVLVLLLHRKWQAVAFFAVGFAAIAWHLLYTWNWMFGRPLFFSYAESGFLSRPRYILPLLFSGGRGLFVWSPLTTLALAGLMVMVRRYLPWALSMGLAFLLQLLLNAGVADWWGGWGFGMRRMTELYPVFVIGLAYLLGETRPAWLRTGLWLLTVFALAFTILLFLSHLNFVFTVPDRPQGDTALAEIRHQLTQSSFQITWQVFLDHFGPWAWSRPGP